MFTIKNLLLCLVVFVTIASCKKEGETYVIQEGNFTSGGLTASSNNLVLTQAIENNNAVTFSWPAANFGKNTAVAYTLQLTLPPDTSGANAWSNAKSFAVGNNVLNYGLIVKELNSQLTTMGVPTGTPTEVVARVKAEVPQYNGSASSIPAVYSTNLVIRVTTYGLSFYIPGDYQGWNPATAPELNQFEGRPGIYEAYVYMPGTGAKYFKYTNARDWNHTNYGDGGNGTFSTDGAAAGLSVPNGGYYQVSANLNTNRWTATKTTWGIIGDATPGGWNTDTQMAYDPATEVWTVTTNLTKNGSFKFRANNAWALNFGINNTGKLVYADNPLIPYTPGINNLSVAEDGLYKITLDLHQSQNYTYSIVKQ